MYYFVESLFFMVEQESALLTSFLKAYVPALTLADVIVAESHALKIKASVDDKVKGAIFHGVPGTGKSMAAKCLAGEMKWNFIQAPSLTSVYVGGAVKLLYEIAMFAQGHKPCILCFDEADSFLSKRLAQNDTNAYGHNLLVNTFLQFLDQLDPDVKVILTTNFMAKLDDAVTRSGRLEHKVEFTKNEPRLVWDHYLKKQGVRVDKQLRRDPSMIDACISDMTPADIESLVQKLPKRVTHRFLLEAIVGPRRKLDAKRAEHQSQHEAAHIVCALHFKRRVLYACIGLQSGGGYTRMRSNASGFLDESKEYLTILMAGRAAERMTNNLHLESCDTDLRQAKDMARRYHKMGHAGTFCLSEKKQRKFINRVLDDGLNAAQKILESQRTQWLHIAEQLAAKQLLDEKEIQSLLNLENPVKSRKRKMDTLILPPSMMSSKAFKDLCQTLKGNTHVVLA